MGQSPSQVVGVTTFLTALALIAIVLRFCARRLKKVDLGWDDYTILPAMLFTIVSAICIYVGTADGDLAKHIELDAQGNGVWTHRDVVFLEINFVQQLSTTLTFGLTKLSVLLFYKRVFRGNTFNAAVWTMISIIGVWFVAFFFANLLQCYPIELNWEASGAQATSCIQTNTMYLAQAWTDVLTDVMILSLPIPCIWALQMPARHKVGVTAIFLLGVLTVLSGIVKLIVFYHIIAEAAGGDFDITWFETPAVLWGMIESALGIVGACLPLLRPLFTGTSTRGFMRNLRSVAVRTITGAEEPKLSEGSTTAVGSGSGSSGKKSGKTAVENGSDSLGAQSGSENTDTLKSWDEKDYDYNSHCTLNTHGHLDQKRVTVESIGSFVDVGERGSSGGKRRGDDNV
ncbi:MAG: hypothetical protein ASARMPREDX12_007561 [Alectoria sarmentosa]|nr:MAG: hypothetical protein ASARMPREDX12_007561 [Alectoria sarmentosa]